MAALTTHNNCSRHFLWKAAGVDPNLSPCVWGAQVWLHWNLVRTDLGLSPFFRGGAGGIRLLLWCVVATCP